MSAISHQTCPAAFGMRLPLWRQLKQLLRPDQPLLRVERMPEHLKRDLGLSGGRATPPRDPMRD